jgi:hypothetical protein
MLFISANNIHTHSTTTTTTTQSLLATHPNFESTPSAITSNASAKAHPLDNISVLRVMLLAPHYSVL